MLRKMPFVPDPDNPLHKEVLSAEVIKFLDKHHPEEIPSPVEDFGGYRSVPNSAYMDIETPNIPLKYSKMPILLNSIDTLRFLEIQEAHVIQIWNAFGRSILIRGYPLDHNFPKDYNLLVVVREHILDRVHQNCDEDDGEDAWRRLFTAMGMAESFIDRIMHPDFKAMRMTYSAKGIVRKYLESKWEFLGTVGQQITVTAEWIFGCPMAQLILSSTADSIKAGSPESNL